MINIKVCVGSSCHLKGSPEVIEELKAIIKKYDVEDLVELQASFCLESCSQAVSIKIEGFENHGIDKETTVVHNVNKNNIEEVFVENIYSLLKI
ncbi:MAG: (2Fe-2S) ferredoxin domain-containing protein [Bacteroidales bacterium]|jgi:NADH:ubiquinone oxidoreductase subunit E